MPTMTDVHPSVSALPAPLGGTLVRRVWQPGLDFDPVDGSRFVRLSFAVSTAEVEEACRRMAPWFETYARLP